MTMKLFRLLLLSALLLVSAVAQAGKMYVTDRIVLDLYESDSSISPVLKTLPTGTPMTVLETNGPYVRVKLKDGTTGWVESGFLTDEQPIQNLYTELMAEHRTLKKKLDANPDSNRIKELEAAAKDAGWMKVEMDKARNEAKDLKSKLSKSENELASLKKEISALKVAAAEQARAQPEQGSVVSVANVTNELDDAALALDTIEVVELPVSEESTGGISIYWLIGTMPVLLIIGIVLGMVWLDARIRARHGGMRLY